MLHGEALRAELRRICSLAYVMPEPKPDYDANRGRPGASDNDLLQRSLSLKEAARKRQEKLVVARAEAAAKRPKGTLYRDEVCLATGRSTFWFEKKVRASGIKPVKKDLYAWYAVKDLQRAGILPQVG